MTHVVVQPCFGCKYTDCVVVCPVECFYEGDQMLYIHPDECIDCEACVPECPVEAIVHQDKLPEAQARGSVPRDLITFRRLLASPVSEAAKPLATTRCYA